MRNVGGKREDSPRLDKERGKHHHFPNKSMILPRNSGAEIDTGERGSGGRHVRIQLISTQEEDADISFQQTAPKIDFPAPKHFHSKIRATMNETHFKSQLKTHSPIVELKSPTITAAAAPHTEESNFGWVRRKIEGPNIDTSTNTKVNTNRNINRDLLDKQNRMKINKNNENYYESPNCMMGRKKWGGNPRPVSMTNLNVRKSGNFSQISKSKGDFNGTLEEPELFLESHRDNNYEGWGSYGSKGSKGNSVEKWEFPHNCNGEEMWEKKLEVRRECNSGRYLGESSAYSSSAEQSKEQNKLSDNSLNVEAYELALKESLSEYKQSSDIYTQESVLSASVSEQARMYTSQGSSADKENLLLNMKAVVDPARYIYVQTDHDQDSYLSENLHIHNRHSAAKPTSRNNLIEEVPQIYSKSLNTSYWLGTLPSRSLDDAPIMEEPPNNNTLSKLQMDTETSLNDTLPPKTDDRKTEIMHILHELERRLAQKDIVIKSLERENMEVKKHNLDLEEKFEGLYSRFESVLPLIEKISTLPPESPTSSKLEVVFERDSETGHTQNLSQVLDPEPSLFLLTDPDDLHQPSFRSISSPTKENKNIHGIETFRSECESAGGPSDTLNSNICCNKQLFASGLIQALQYDTNHKTNNLSPQQVGNNASNHINNYKKLLKEKDEEISSCNQFILFLKSQLEVTLKTYRDNELITNLIDNKHCKSLQM